MKYRGFEIQRKKKKINWWKGLVLFILLVPILSFFSFVDIIYANKHKLINFFELNQNYGFVPYQLGKLISDYYNHKNLKKDISSILILLNHPIFLAGVLNLDESEVIKISKIVKTYFSDFLNVFGFEVPRTYLVILENTGEERPDGGFFGSFAKITLSGGYIEDFKIYDSYYLLWKFCNEHTKNLPKEDWFKHCNKSGLNLAVSFKPFNKLFPNTTFLTSNIFGFTSLNAKNIIKHYNKVFDNKIDGVIFVKSDILKYLFSDGQKILWEMEYLNYISKQKKSISIKKNISNLKGLSGKKAQYLLYLNNLLQKNKLNLLRNFVNNFSSIQKEGLLRFYLPFTSKKFKKFLMENNFVLEKEPNYAYFFFYNLGFTKTSKFINHFVKINDKVYINPSKIKLKPGIYKIWIKHTYIPDNEYLQFLKKKKISLDSYLASTTIKYKNLLILPSYCEIKDKKNDFYLVYCK